MQWLGGMKTTTVQAGDEVLVHGMAIAWHARVLAVRGAWATIQELGTRREDEYRADDMRLEVISR